MKTFVKNTLLAMTLSTGMVLANEKTTTMLDIDKVLPRTVSVDLPEFSKKKGTAWASYSPQQRASIVGLELTADAAQYIVPQVAEATATIYSPQQKASIVGLKLTANAAQHKLPTEAKFSSMKYSPLQMAKIVGLKLTAEEVQEVPAQQVKEATQAYSPQQKAKIAGLVLTAE